VGSLAMTLRRHPAVALAGEVVAGRLFDGSLAMIRGRQQEIYVADQGGMAKIADAATNPAWKIAATITDAEIEAVLRLPVNGRDLTDALVGAATLWRDEFRAGLIRSLTGGPWIRSPGIQAAVRSVGSAFDRWVSQVGKIAYAACIVALHASAREFRLAFTPPAKIQTPVVS